LEIIDAANLDPITYWRRMHHSINILAQRKYTYP
jgi:hypothetical protein